MEPFKQPVCGAVYLHQHRGRHPSKAALGKPSRPLQTTSVGRVQRPMRNPGVAMEEGVTQPKEDIPGEIMTPSAAAKGRTERQEPVANGNKVSN